MDGWRRVLRWPGGHPTASSVLLAGAVLALAAIGPRGPNDQPLPVPSAGGWVVLVLACAALVVRGRWPVPVWAAVLALSVTGILLDGTLARPLLALVVTLYTVAAWRPVRTVLAVSLVSAAAMLAASAVIATDRMFVAGTYGLLATGGMATAIGVAVRNQRAVLAAAVERARTAELTRDEEAQRRVAEERLRIARELHDVVAHHIAVVNVQAGVARHLLASDPAAADAALGNVRQAAGLVLREMQTVIGLLRTTEDVTETAPAPGIDRLDALVEEVRHAGLVVEWSVTGAPRPLEPAADLAAYRLVQEALTNARRHGTGTASLLVGWTPAGLLLEIGNPLPGAPPSALDLLPGKGFGLIGMRERVTAAGGTLTLRPGPDRFLVRAELPYLEAS